MDRSLMDQGTRIVVLSGAGLSKSSGVPTFRDGGGLWEGHRVHEVATPEAWQRQPDLVRRFYDERRLGCVPILPNDGHEALARLQQALGTRRCVLVTQNVDGLLQKAGAHDVIEMHGSLWRLRCGDDASHPAVGIFGKQNPSQKCRICGAPMRPDIVWFGEVPYDMDPIHEAVARCDVFVSVGTSGVVYPAAGLVSVAKHAKATCIEINPVPTDSGVYQRTIAKPAEVALPELVAKWLGE